MMVMGRKWQRQPPLVPTVPTPSTTTTGPMMPGTPTQQNLTIIGPLVPNCQGACMLSRILCPAARISCVVPSTCYQIVPVPVARITNGTSPPPGTPGGPSALVKTSDLIYGGKVVPPYNGGVDTSCEDKSKNCAAFSDLCKENIYHVFMQHHCRRTCGFCTRTNPPTDSTIDAAKPLPISPVLPTPPPPPSPTSSSFPSPMRRLKPTALSRRMRKIKPAAVSATTAPPTTTSAQPDSSAMLASKSISGKSSPKDVNNSTVTEPAVKGRKTGKGKKMMKKKNKNGENGSDRSVVHTTTVSPSTTTAVTATPSPPSTSTTEASFSSSGDLDAAHSEEGSPAAKRNGKSGVEESAASHESVENTSANPVVTNDEEKPHVQED